jgi:hypothetical protein
VSPGPGEAPRDPIEAKFVEVVLHAYEPRLTAFAPAPIVQ